MIASTETATLGITRHGHLASFDCPNCGGSLLTGSNRDQLRQLRKFALKHFRRCQTRKALA